MNNVKTINPNIKISGEINKNLIEALENLLERAKKGDMTSIAFVGAGDEDNSDIISGIITTELTNIFQLLGGLDNLRFTINLDMIE